MFGLFHIGALVVYRLDVSDELGALGDQLVLGRGLQLPADVLSETLQEFDLFRIRVVFLLDLLLLLLELFLQSFEDGHEILFNEALPLPDLGHQLLHLELYLVAIFPEPVYFLVETG